MYCRALRYGGKQFTVLIAVLLSAPHRNAFSIRKLRVTQPFSRPENRLYSYSKMNKALLALKAILAKRNLVFLPLVIISVIALILLNYYTIKIISSARAYVNGESQYSKSQKDASAHLINYVYRADATDYQLFLEDLSVPLGDRKARVNLINASDQQIIRDGFLKGKNHPDDIADMIWLYHSFNWLAAFKYALKTWEEGDELVGRLLETGKSIHRTNNLEKLTEAQKRLLVNQINRLSAQLTAKEEEFSGQFGFISREADRYIFICNCLLTLVIFGCSLAYADRMIRMLARLNHEVADKNEALTDTNERLDKMMFTVTHDLRSPLATVSGLIGLLEEETDPDAKASYLSMMKNCITRQDEFISAMLNAEAEIQTARECDLVQLFNDIHTQHYLDAAGRPVDFRISLGVTQVKSPPLKLKTIFNNLVSNAIKYFDYTKDTPVEITIVSRREGSQVILEVRDNGLGIAKSNQRKIFDKFFMAQRNRTSTGLGLYLVEEAVKELHGSIEVSSELGKGSVFTVRIPA
jgi:signal transduction histidine kinase